MHRNWVLCAAAATFLIVASVFGSSSTLASKPESRRWDFTSPLWAGVTAQQGWGFGNTNITNPGPTILVQASERLHLTLNSIDVSHRFHVDYNGNNLTDPGEPDSMAFLPSGPGTLYEFDATATVGTYFYRCAIHGFGFQRGLFIVEPTNVAPTVDLTTPDGVTMNRWSGGSVHRLTWSMSDPDEPSTGLTVFLNFTSSAGNGPIAGPLVGLTQYDWLLPLIDTTDLQVIAEVTDSTGMVGSDVASLPVVDSTAPMVTSTVPVNGATGVAVDTPIVISFSEGMQTNVTGTPASVALHEILADRWVPLTYNWDPSNSVLSSAHPNLVPSTQYELSVNTSSLDSSSPGNALAAPYTSTFVTGAGVAPSLTIVTPSDFAEVSALGVRLTLDVVGFSLNPVLGGSVVAGEGHIHLYADGTLAAMFASTYVDVTNIPPGPHTLRVELVNNDHSPLAPPVSQSIGVTAVSPSIAILAPADGSAVSTLGVRVPTSALGITLDAENYGGPNVPGHGHIHFMVDGALVGAVTGAVFDFGSLSAGPHTLRAELRNNDHSPLSPAVFDEISVTAIVPSIAFQYPLDQAVVSTTGFASSVAVNGLELDDENFGGPNVPGHGHIHYFADGALAGMSATDTFDFGTLSPGTHLIRAELRNNDHSPLGSPASAQIQVDASGPVLVLLSPSDGGFVSTLGFRASVQLDFFELDTVNFGGPNRPGHGHIHWFLDGGLAAMTTAPRWDFLGVGAGSHIVRAELANSDHSPLNPPVLQTITVTATDPSIAFLIPWDGSLVSTVGFRADLQVDGFTLDPANYGGANIPGHGHIHYMVDGFLVSANPSTVFDFGTLTAGGHTIEAELRNNDHSPLSPAVKASIVITAGPPMIEIVQPTNGAVVSSLGFRVVIRIVNLTVDAENYGGPNVPGHGHWHLMRGASLLAAALEDTVVVTGETVGSLTLDVSLRNNDHSLLAPGFTDSVTVTVGAPSISGTVPSLVDEGDPVVVSWTVTGFILDSAAFGGPVEPGRGHVHVYLDGVLATMTAGNTAAIGNVIAGSHTVRVDLVNNNHSPLSPAVSDSDTVSVVAPPGPPGGSPSIEILEPADGSTASSLGFRLRVRIQDFTVDVLNYGTPNNIPGQGHWHLMEGTTLLFAPLADVVVVTGLSAGSHTLEVSLRNNDHSPVSPAVTDSVTFTVAAPAVSVSGLSTITAGDVAYVNWTVTGFVLDSTAIGGANEAGRGHVHVLVDGAYFVASAGGTVAIPGLSEGLHTITVELHNNDHSQVTPIVSNAIAVTVQAPHVPPTTEAGISPTVFYGSVGFLLVALIALAALLMRRGRKMGGGKESATDDEEEL